MYRYACVCIYIYSCSLRMSLSLWSCLPYLCTVWIAGQRWFWQETTGRYFFEAGPKRLPHCLIMLTCEGETGSASSFFPEIIGKKWKPPVHVFSIPFVVCYALMNLLDHSKFNMRYSKWTKIQWFGTLQFFRYRKPQTTSDPGTSRDCFRAAQHRWRWLWAFGLRGRYS
jgi:hypothetical protein